MEATDELWMSSEWVETGFDKHPWMKKNRDEMNDKSPSRWFVIKGTQWPLICMTVYQNYPLHPVGVRVAVSMKDQANGWFQESTLPPALVPMLIETLKAGVGQ